MRIYDLSKVLNSETLEVIKRDLPRRVITDPGLHKIESKEDVPEYPFMRFDTYHTSNPITFTNLRIEDNWIVGDMFIGPITRSFRSRNILDLTKDNTYKLLFKPSFETEMNDDMELVICKFHSFYVYAYDITSFREERLAKLLELK